MSTGALQLTNAGYMLSVGGGSGSFTISVILKIQKTISSTNSQALNIGEAAHKANRERRFIKLKQILLNTSLSSYIYGYEIPGTEILWLEW